MLVGEDYNYGRDVHKGEIKERLQLPYEKYELEECSIFSRKKSHMGTEPRGLDIQPSALLIGRSDLVVAKNCCAHRVWRDARGLSRVRSMAELLVDKPWAA